MEPSVDKRKCRCQAKEDNEINAVFIVVATLIFFTLLACVDI